MTSTGKHYNKAYTDLVEVKIEAELGNKFLKGGIMSSEVSLRHIYFDAEIACLCTVHVGVGAELKK